MGCARCRRQAMEASVVTAEINETAEAVTCRQEFAALIERAQTNLRILKVAAKDPFVAESDEDRRVAERLVRAEVLVGARLGTTRVRDTYKISPRIYRIVAHLSPKQREWIGQLTRALTNCADEGGGLYRLHGANAKGTEHKLVEIGLIERYNWVPPRWRSGIERVRITTDLGLAVAVILAEVTRGG